MKDLIMSNFMFHQNIKVPVIASYNREYDVIDAMVFLNQHMIESAPEVGQDNCAVVYIPLQMLDTFSNDVEERDNQIAYYLSDSGYICDLYKTEFTELKIHMM